MSQCESRACWFAGGLLTGAIVAGLCAVLASRRVPLAVDPAATDDPSPAPQAASHPTDAGSEMFEYRGFVVHLFCQALGADRYRSWCDIWESGAVVQEAGGPPATYATATEARMAAGAWARHWIQNNG